VGNDPGEGLGGAFADLLRLQTDFQARLADETLRYLRRLQGAAAPAVPGTVLLPDGEVELRGAGVPGTAVQLRVEVENRQRVHCVVTPMLTPLVAASGVTWFPAAAPEPPSMLLAPSESRELAIELPLPDELPTSLYRGALILQGFRDGGIPVAIEAEAPRAAPAKRRAARRTSRARPRKDGPK
jgi:hypothetical protein